MTTITITSPAPVAAPRGAIWAAAAAAQVLRWMSARDAHVGFQTRPAAAAEMAQAPTKAKADKNSRQRSLEAANVRRMAMQMRYSDPGFTADLLAAADRHER